MELFKSIKNYDPEKIKMVEEHIDGEVVKMVVEFLKIIVVGNVEHEKNFATSLKEDIV